MPRHHGQKRSSVNRSPPEWVLRAFLSICVLVLGYFSIISALTNVIMNVDPISAFRLNSGDGRIVGALVEHEFAVAPDMRPASMQANLAATALRLDPTSVKALNVLGLQAQMRSDSTSADRIFGYSVRLSRRELQPQIWSIEKAVNRGNIDQALRNYDIALRTSSRAREILFPILSAAIAAPEIRVSLSPILLENPNWAGPFLQFSAVRSPEPNALADLFRTISAKGFSIGEDERVRLVNNLVAKGLMEEAWDYYVSFRSGASLTSSRDPTFAFDEGVPARFDWNLGSAPGLSVAILRDGRRGVLDFSVPPSTGATVASQMQMLLPGKYQLDGRSAGVDQPIRSRPYWSLRCHSGQELGRVTLPNSVENNGSFSGTFIVPTTCAIQTLSLVLRASDSIFGVAGQIEKVKIVRVEQ